MKSYIRIKHTTQLAKFRVGDDIRNTYEVIAEVAQSDGLKQTFRKLVAFSDAYVNSCHQCVTDRTRRWTAEHLASVELSKEVLHDDGKSDYKPNNAIIRISTHKRGIRNSKMEL